MTKRNASATATAKCNGNGNCKVQRQQQIPFGNDKLEKQVQRQEQVQLLKRQQILHFVQDDNPDLF